MMKEKLTQLFEVRKLTALFVVVVFCYMAIVGKITPDQFQPVLAMVIGFYFGRSTALDKPGEDNGNE